MRTHARIALAVVAFAPLLVVTACDMVKKDADAGAAPVPTVATPGVDAAVAPPVVPTDPGPAPPLGGTTTAVNPTPTGVRPVGDGGVRPVGDAGPATATDAGKPGSTPTLTFPPIPGFEAGAFVPPAFDAGGFKPPWQK